MVIYDPISVRFYLLSLCDNVRFGLKADMCSAKSDVRFAPESDI